MDGTIICPNCGETNPADMSYCHNCQWRLQPLDDERRTDQASDRTLDSQPSAADGPEGDAVPDWLRLAPAQSLPELSADEAAAAQLRERLDSAGSEDLHAGGSQRGESEDLLAGLTHATEPDDEPIPDWVARIMGITDSDDSDQSLAGEAGRPADSGRVSNYASTWLSPEVGGPPPDESQFETASTVAGTRASQDEREPVPQADTGSQGRESDDIYEWLRQLDASNVAPPERTSRQDVPATTDVPTWVGRMQGVPGQAAVDAGSSGPALPNWLQGAPPPAEDPLSSHLHGGADTVTPAAPPEQTASTPAHAPPAEPPADTTSSHVATPGLTADDADTLDVDAIFASMQMPSWASPSEPSETIGTTAKPPAAHDDASIELAELPSWVRALRPAESAMVAAKLPQVESASEAGGPLRGLEGVLPTIPGAAVPSSRPKPYAMTLDISERQQALARLLEEMLQAETHPLRVKGAVQVGSPRALRWLIGAVLLALLLVGLGSGSTNFALPAGIPAESTAAIQVVQDLAPDAPVLAVFDYEPATAGEMEVVAASLMDHLLLLKHPRLAVLSTSPTGSALAERFISTSLRERAYSRDLQYVDLGYLPGGLSGVQFFAKDPVAATPYGAATDRVWDTPVLLGLRRLTDFSAIIVLTDNLESGAVWIEQTTGLRGPTPMVMVSSAQAGPLLLPYFDSNQIQGLVVGINGAAGTEIANGGRPGQVRRYWDAYNLGLYAASVLVTLGALWQVASGFRRRQGEAT